MAFEFRTRRRVQFADTDCAGIAHFAVFFRYMEEAEHEFLRSLNLSVRTPAADDATVGFPRLSARCEYSSPVRFEDVVDIHLWVSRKTRSTLQYAFVFSLKGEEVARGLLAVISCEVREGRSIEAIPLPQAFAEALEQAPYPELDLRQDQPRTQ